MMGKKERLRGYLFVDAFENAKNKGHPRQSGSADNVHCEMTHV